MKQNPGLLIICLLWQTVYVVNAAPYSRATHEDDIIEAAFRFQLHPYQVSTSPKSTRSVSPIRRKKQYVSPFKVFFLSLSDSKDPSDNLMKRFADHKPPVKKVSQSYIDYSSKEAKTEGLLVRDKTTKEFGTIYTASDIRWLNKNKVTMNWGYYSGGRQAVMNTYTLRVCAQREQ